jgi:myo-inositol-1(or 4)-monophosphatase
MRATAGVRRAGAAALDLCAVAAGRFDAFWEHSLEPWDFAAGALIIREAGGVITDLRGEPLSLSRSGVLAGNPWMHEWMLKELARS